MLATVGCDVVDIAASLGSSAGGVDAGLGMAGGVPVADVAGSVAAVRDCLASRGFVPDQQQTECRCSWGGLRHVASLKV